LSGGFSAIDTVRRITPFLLSRLTFESLRLLARFHIGYPGRKTTLNRYNISLRASSTRAIYNIHETFVRLHPPILVYLSCLRPSKTFHNKELIGIVQYVHSYSRNTTYAYLVLNRFQLSSIYPLVSPNIISKYESNLHALHAELENERETAFRWFQSYRLRPVHGSLVIG